MRLNVIIFLVILLLYGCYSETNTVDPQTSSNIESSQKEQLFIGRYQVVQVPSEFFKIKEAWSEHVWKYMIKNGQRQKIASLNQQLILSIYNEKSTIKSDDIDNNWKIKFSSPISSFTLQGNIFSFRFNGSNAPDTVSISVLKMINGNWNEEGQINFFRRK